MEYTAKYAPTVVSQDPKHGSSGSNVTMAYKRNRSGYDPMITEYTAKDAPAVITLDVNANNSRSHGNRQSTNINDDSTVETDNETEILCTPVKLLLKFQASNNARNATRNLIQDFPVQIKQSDRHVVFLPWYS